MSTGHCTSSYRSIAQSELGDRPTNPSLPQKIAVTRSVKLLWDRFHNSLEKATEASVGWSIVIIGSLKPGGRGSVRLRDRLTSQVVVVCVSPIHSTSHTAQVHPSVRKTVSENIMSIDPAITRHQTFRYRIGPFDIG